MAKKILGLANFKKVHEDAQSATLRHPDGHEIKIAKSILSPEHAKQLQSLPLHASDANQGDPIPDPAPDAQDAGGASGSWGDIAANQAQPQSNQASQANTAENQPQKQDNANYTPPDKPVPSQQQDQASAQGAMNLYDPSRYIEALSDQTTGLTRKAKAEGDLGKQQAKEAERDIVDTQGYQNDMKLYNTQAQNEFSNFSRDMDSMKIDPDKYVKEHMPTLGSKIGTVLALMVSGIGGAITHTQNMAEKFLDQGIQQDIEAQKQKISNRVTVYNANLQNLKNQKEATDMTFAMHKYAAAKQMEVLADKMQDPIKKNEALSAAGALKYAAAGVVNNITLGRQIQTHLLSHPFNQNEWTVAAGHMIPEGPQRQKALEELGSYGSISQLHQKMNESFDRIASMSPIGRVVNPSLVNTERNSLMGMIEADVEHRYNHDQMKNMVATLMPSNMDFSKETLMAKKKNADAMFNSMVKTPNLTAGLGGVSPPKFVSKINSGASNPAGWKKSVAKK